jgi:hypothetical protein
LGNSLLFDNGTNVGIGTTTPSAKLDVSGSAYIAGAITLPQNPTGTTYGNGVSASPPYMINQGAGDNDAIRFYSESAATNQVSMVFEINDDIETAGNEWIWRNKKTYGGYEATTPMLLSGAGAATFLSSVTAGAFLTNGASGAAGQEAIRINNDNGYIGFFNSANNTRSGYIQGNTTDLTITTSPSTPLIFGTANAERMRITSSGNVGIGTTAPGAKLDIVSTASGSEGLRIDGSGGGFAFVVKGGSDYTSHIRAGATIGVNYFTTPPSNGLIVEGNVGIGTTTPSTFGGGGLTLGTSSLGKNLIINSSANGSTGLLQFVDLNGNNSLQIFGGSTEMTFYGYGNRPMSFYTNDAERMRITSSGNVGIGTASPSAKLDVSGGNINSFYSYFGGAENYNIRLKNDLSSDNGYIAQLAGTTSLSSNSYYSISGLYKATSTTSSSIHLDSGNVIFNAQSGLTSGSDFSLTERMRITSGGNVGIGTSSPTFVTPGTTVLDVNGSTGATIYLRANVAQGSYLRQTSNNLVIGNNTYGDIIYNTGFTEAMRVTADRLVGIGTANPSSKLQVNNSSWAITGANVSRMLQKSVGTAGDYEQHVILLHPIYNGTLIAYNKCSGTIFASRGGTSSGLINDTYNVDTASAYNSYNGTINSTIGYGRLYTCNYNGVKYLALLPDYRTSAVQYNFDGYINSTGEELKLVVYRMSNSGTIVNSEVNNSLTIFGAGVTYYQGDLGVKGAILDSSNSPGTSGQVLSSTGTGTAWITGGGGGSQNLQQVTDVGNSTTNIIYFNGNVPIYGVNNSVFLGSENLPNGTGYALALEETSVGVYDNITGVFETGVYAKRNINCSPWAIGGTELLTITSPNTIVDSVIKIGYDDRFFIAKLSVIIDSSTQKYTYKIIYTNTTNFDDYNFVNNIDFIFEFDTNLPPNFTIKLNNNTGNDIYANINANIL